MESNSWNSRLEDHWSRGSSQESSPDHTSVVHLDITDKDHQERNDLTQRKTYSSTLNLLAETDARALIFDMIFPNSEGEEADLPFTGAISGFGRTYLSVGLEPSSRKSSSNLAMNGLVTPAKLSAGGIPYIDRLLSNPSHFNSAAKGVGHIAVPADPDGIYRRIPLIFLAGEGKVLPATILRVLLDHWNIEDEGVSIVAGKAIDLKKPDGSSLSIPIDEQGRMVLNFLGPWTKGFPHLSLAKVLKAEEDDSIFDYFADLVEDRFVIFADVSTYSHDVGATPLEKHAPLPTLHANALQQILDGRFFYPLSALSTFFLWVLPALVLLLLGQARANWLYLLGSLSLGLILYAFHRHARIEEHWLSQPLNHLLAVAISFLALFIHRHESVLRARRRLRQQFASYIAPSILDRVVENPNFLNVVDRKEITVMFTDIAGFTRWSSTQDPVSIHRFLNEYFEAMTDIVFQHEGTIDKFIGDGLMVFWGDPVTQEDQADRAIRTGLAMQKALDGLRDTWKDRYQLDISLRVGINTGSCTVGNLGSSRRLDYTTVGANVNLAQRLESQCPNGEILISARTLEIQSSLQSELEAMDIKAKGYDQPITVYRVDPSSTAISD